MSPQERREQLLELGTTLLARSSLEELSIEMLAAEAGISRGLLYHYFGSKHEFHLAVVRRAVQDLYQIVAPQDFDDPIEQLTASLGAYADYVKANYSGYVSLVRAAQGGDDDLRAIYYEARAILTSRIFDEPSARQLAALGIQDSPQLRLLLNGWAAMVEEVVVAWVEDDRGLDRDEVLARLASGLLALLGAE